MLCHDGLSRITILRTAFAGLLLLASGSGCGLHHAYCTNDCGDSAMVAGVGGCSDGDCVAGGCGGDIYPGTCGAKSLGYQGGLSGFCLPLLSTRLACGSGCGEVYWNEWICDPPECCDPCDDAGCWVGPQPCAHPGGILWGAVGVVKGAAVRVIHLGLYGYRGGGCSGGCAGCSDCEYESCSDCGECMDCGGMGCAGGCASTSVGSRSLMAHSGSQRPRTTASTSVAHRSHGTAPVHGRIVR